MPLPSIYDEQGDLHLVVGGSYHAVATTFKVSSETLVQASEVWQRIIACFEPEATDGNTWTIEVPEDKVEPTIIVLDILHNRWDRVPEYLTIRQLYDLLVLTDRYGMISILQFWISKWLFWLFDPAMNRIAEGIAPLIAGVPLEGCMENHILENHIRGWIAELSLSGDRERGLWVAWLLGLRHMFTLMIIAMASNSVVQDDGQLISICDHSPWFTDVSMPPIGGESCCCGY
ncbi:hypothetical protein F4778DRAFT_799053 [Xylariomycetidae sp. FL2044]|nr:hypothetical protein F4778DRAFT_799053 [Xylariomycetidae sp. FL2044]